MGAAACATSSPNRRTADSASGPRESHSPRSASSAARNSSAAAAGRGSGRPSRSRCPPARARGAGRSRTSHRDDHRVAHAHLRELLRAGRPAGITNRGDQLVGGQRRALHPGVELPDRDVAWSPAPTPPRPRRRGQQRGMGVAGRRRRAEVAADRAPVADLRRADGAGRHRQPGQPATELVDHPGVRHARAEPDDPASADHSARSANPGQVQERVRPRRSKLMSTITSVPPAIASAPGCSALMASASAQVAGRKNSMTDSRTLATARSQAQKHRNQGRSAGDCLSFPTNPP